VILDAPGLQQCTADPARDAAKIGEEVASNLRSQKRCRSFVLKTRWTRMFDRDCGTVRMVSPFQGCVVLQAPGFLGRTQMDHPPLIRPRRSEGFDD
jgi:hypothetical protein